MRRWLSKRAGAIRPHSAVVRGPYSTLHRVKSGGLSSRLDRSPDARIGPAPANVARHRCVDIGVAGVGGASQQRRRAHDLARLAIATLYHFEIEPGLLNLPPTRRFADCLDRGDVFSRGVRDRHDTGAYRPT